MNKQFNQQPMNYEYAQPQQPMTGNGYNEYGQGRSQGFKKTFKNQSQQPQLSIEEQIAQRLDIYALILRMAEERGIAKDELIMASGLTAWVTSMVVNFKR